MASVAGVGSGAGGEASGSAVVGAASTGVVPEAGGASGVSDAAGASAKSIRVNWTCYTRYISKHTGLIIITLIVNHLLNSRVVEYRGRRHYPPIDRLFLGCSCRGIEVLPGAGRRDTVRIRPWRDGYICELAHGVSNKSMRCFEIEGSISCATCYISRRFRSIAGYDKRQGRNGDIKRGVIGLNAERRIRDS
jgi:hypothetical protein